MLQTVVYGVLVVGGVCLLSLIGLELVHRLVPATSRQPHNDVAGFIYAALGVIYAVLLALVVISVWEEYQAAAETVEQEANSVAEIFWLGYELPEPEGTHLQQLARAYAEEVVHKEWPLMAQGNQSVLEQEAGTPAGWDLIDDIRATLHGFEPHTTAGCIDIDLPAGRPYFGQSDKPLIETAKVYHARWVMFTETRCKAEEQLYAEGLDQVGRLSDARRTRLIASEEGVPGILWSVLIFGGIAAVGFTYLFGLESTWAHRLMVVTLAAVIGLVLFTIGALGHPFEGGARIGPEFFELVLERIETSKLSDIR